PQGTVVTYTVSVTDEVGTPTLSCAPPSGSLFPVGDTEVRCDAEDQFGNDSHRSFHVRVVDTTSPVISDVPADISLMVSRGDQRVTYTLPTASDSVDGPVRVECNPHSGDQFRAGTTTVRCRAEDDAHNQATATFDVTLTVTAALKKVKR